MICLFIDTSISIPTIAIVKDNNILFLFHEEIKNDMSSKILPIIDDGIKTSKIALSSIDKIFIVNGPGSFTGIRIGVTIAKTLAWSLNKDLIELSSLEYIATTHTNKKYLIPMIDARRGNVFAAIYDSDLKCVKEDCLINKEELLKNIDFDFDLISYDSFENIIYPKPDVIRIINKHMNDKSINPHNLKPNYLKLTEAEENRLKNG